MRATSLEDPIERLTRPRYTERMIARFNEFQKRTGGAETQLGGVASKLIPRPEQAGARQACGPSGACTY